jgi:hypothetical protein
MRSHSTKAVNSSCNTIWMITPITLKSQLTMSWGNPVTQANKKKENPEECEGLLATYFSFWRISFMWLPLYILGYPLQHCWIPLPFIFDWRKINMLYIVCKTLIDNIRAQILTQCVKCDVESLACIYGCGCKKSYCSLWTYLPLIWLWPAGFVCICSGTSQFKFWWCKEHLKDTKVQFYSLLAIFVCHGTTWSYFFVLSASCT